MPVLPVRRIPSAAALLAAAVLLAGCGGSAPAGPAPSATAGDSAFPVTITHAFGESTVPAAPQPVVALGVSDLAVAQAVGAPLVGAIRNPSGSTPELPYLDPLPADVLSIDPAGEVLSVEQVAAFRPDLILGVGSFLVGDQAVYDQLARIAPTVVYPESLYGSSMQDDARQIGRALGREAAVEELIAASDRQVSELRGELPDVEGKTYLYAQARGERLLAIVGDENLSTAFLRSLGLDVPASFRGATDPDAPVPGTVALSYEEASRLTEADLLLMTFASPGDRGVFEGNELVTRVRAVQDGTYTPVDLDQAVALQAPNVVSTGWLIDQLRPALERVAAG